MSSKGKIAIVSSGGGMRCSYGAGALVALAKVHGITNPNIVIAASGSVGSSMYYIAGQYDTARTVWTQRIATSRFISLLRFWRVMDIDYLIDSVFRRQIPMDIKVITSTPIRYFIPLVNTKTKEICFISNENRIDIFELMRAAKSIPFITRGRVRIGDDEYTDAAFRVSFEELIQKARDEGAETIVAIDNRSDWKRAALSAAADVILITSDDIPVELMTTNGIRLGASFDLGYQTVAKNQRLATLVS